MLDPLRVVIGIESLGGRRHLSASDRTVTNVLILAEEEQTKKQQQQQGLEKRSGAADE